MAFSPIRKLLSSSTIVPSPNSIETSYSPGRASTKWKEPGWTIGPLNIPVPENMPVPLMVPYEVSGCVLSVSKVPEPTNVAWSKVLENRLVPSAVNLPEAFTVPFNR